MIYHLKSQMKNEKSDLLCRIAYGEKLERTTGGILDCCAKDGERQHWLTFQRDGSEEALRALLSSGLLR